LAGGVFDLFYPAQKGVPVTSKGLVTKREDLWHKRGLWSKIGFVAKKVAVAKRVYCGSQRGFNVAKGV
jgi:hypothetical protein